MSALHRRHVLAGLTLGLAAPLAWAGAYEDFFAAILRDDPDTIRALLRRGFDPDTRDTKGQVGLTLAQVEEMYHVMAIANYEDRFVIPTSHREYAENAFDLRGGCGFSFGNGCSDGASETSLFGGSKRRTIPIQSVV